jgi:PEP-CTERM motif
MKNVHNGLLFLFAVALSSPAAADTTWVLGPTPASGITVAGYANTGSGSTANTQLIELQGSSNLRWYSGGWGINNLDGGCSTSGCGDPGDSAGTPPEHAIDNNGRYEMLLVNFSALGKSVSLKNVTLGSINNDSDLTVLAYTAPGAPTLTGKKWADLNQASSGWSVIGNYAGGSNTFSQTINTPSTYSSYWLIGAYNPLAGGSAGFSTTSYDYIKIFSVAGAVCAHGALGCKPPTVPEPSSALLVGLGLVGLMGWRGRRRLIATLRT